MILYFSGTGNSRHAAALLAAEAGGPVISLNERIQHGDHTPLRAEEPLVFVTPTYAWRIPRVVEAHLRETVFSGDRRAYFVMTCGDGTGAAAVYCKRLCSETGLDFMGLGTVVMPENYVAMFPVPEEAEGRGIVARADPGVRALGARIRAGEPLPAKPAGVMGRIYSTLVNPLFYRFCVTARPFRATEGCTGCGACAALCPLNNITLADGRPQWGDRCTHCMACICRCPQGAIEYGKLSAGKPRWRLDD